MLGRFRQKTWSQRFLSGLLALALVSSLASCGDRSGSKNFGIIRTSLAEVAPPEIISELRQTSSKYQPRVKIVSPKADQVLDDTDVSFRFQVDGLPIFKDPDLELGSHLHVTIDNIPYQDVYDIAEPLIIKNLAPGTHTIRVLANSAWHESFKNEGAYAQQTFHVLTKSDDNILDGERSLITYNSPQGDYSALPLLLDFYVSKSKKADPIDKVRVTINGEQFTLKQPEAVYLEGFKKGKNWIKLEALDKNDKVITNTYKDTLGVVNYQSDVQSPLSKLLESNLSVSEALKVVDPKYRPEPAEVIEAPVVEPSPSFTPADIEPKFPDSTRSPVPLIPAAPIPSVMPKLETLPEKIQKDAENMDSKLAPEVEATPVALPSATPEPQASPKSGFLDRFRRSPDKNVNPPTAIETPSVEPTLLPIPEVVLPSPETEVTSPPNLIERLRKRSTAQPEATPAPTPVVVPSPELEKTPATDLIERLKNRSTSTDVETAPTPTPIKTPDAVLQSPETEVTSPPSLMERLRKRSTPKSEATPAPTPVVVPSPELEKTPAPSFIERLRKRSTIKSESSPAPTPVAVPSPELEKTPATDLIERLKNRSTSTDVETAPTPTPIKTPDAVLQSPETEVTSPPSLMERLRKRSNSTDVETAPTPTVVKTPDAVLQSPETEVTSPPNFMERLKKRSTAKPEVIPPPEVEITPAPSLIERLKNRSTSTDVETAPTPTPIKTPNAVLESPKTEVTSPPSLMERLRNRSAPRSESSSTPTVVKTPDAIFPSPAIETTPAPNLIDRLKKRSQPSNDLESTPRPQPSTLPRQVEPTPEVPIFKQSPEPSSPKAIESQTSVKTEPQDKSSEFLQRLLPKDTKLRIETEEGTTEVKAEKLPMIQASPQAGIPSRYLRKSDAEPSTGE